MCSEYTDEEFCEALTAYRNQPISQSLRADDPLGRMFAVLDRRDGKRTLAAIQQTVSAQSEWMKPFYTLRLQAEGLGQPERCAFQGEV